MKICSLKNCNGSCEEKDYRDEAWRNDQLAYLKRALECFEDEPLHDWVLRYTLKWIKELEAGKNPDCWEDSKTYKFSPDTKNWYSCECDAGNIGNYTHAIRERFPHLKKHRHRIYRTLQQAIKELE